MQMTIQPSPMLTALAWTVGILVCAQASAATHLPASTIARADLIQPAELAARLQAPSGPAPLVLQVGFKLLFAQSHITGSEYAGPAGQGDGLAALAQRVAPLPRDAEIVLYCGCCPWAHCPNIAAAYRRLHELGFRHLKVLYIAHDFGTDWVEKGYPASTGE
jgi:thiosulfate/3-mercaptopyruvate sulfurtransferase